MFVSSTRCCGETWAAPQHRHAQTLAVIASQNCSLALTRDDDAPDGIAALRRRGDREAMMAEFEFAAETAQNVRRKRL